MDPYTLNIITSLAVNYFSEFSIATVKGFFNTVIKENPEIEKKIKTAKTPQDFEEVFNESVGIIDAHANTDKIKVDGAFLEALRGIRFNHGNGKVTIQGSTMNAPILVTGGSAGSTGYTTIGENTEMKSQGTNIRIGANSGIYIGGDSKIIQN